MIKIKSINDGFTLVELMLAMSFFSFILLFAVAGFIQINRSYNKGITVKRIHENGRALIENIARTIRTSPSSTISIIPADQTSPDVLVRRICAGGVRYAWNEMRDTNSNLETFASSSSEINFTRTESGASCSDPIVKSNAESFLEVPTVDVNANPFSVNGAIVIYDLDVTRTGNIVHIDLYLSSSDPSGDLLSNIADPTQFSCRGSLLSGQEFCDTVHLSTSIAIRT